MKNFNLVLLVLACSFQAYSQNICFTDEQHQKHLNESESHRTHFYGMNDLVLEKILELRSGGGQEDGLYTIPTVVHVIHNNGAENIAESQVQQAIDWLNESFSNTESGFNPEGTEIPIQFCLAGTDPDGNFTNGINYMQSTLTDMLVPSQDQELKDVIRWPTDQYFNIWVVNSIVREDNSPGVIGYATFPDTHGGTNDGVVIEAEFFGSTQISNTALIHEAGHYLGLYHTFQEGCPNDDCLTSGDQVCDTPPDQALFNFFCFNGTNSCSTDEDDTSINNPFRSIELGGIGDQVDQQSNYMDYSSLHCYMWFTAGQAERMIAAVSVMRNSLFDEDRCATPCSAEFTPNVSANATIINVGESIDFTDSSEGVNSTEWFVDEVLAQSGNTFTFTPDVQGTYVIEAVLNNSDPGCQKIETFTIEVNCDVSISILPDSSNLSQGGTATFTSESTGSTSIDWYIDNVLIQSSDEFEFTFNELGVFSVFAIASNGICEVQSGVWHISVGSCTSGNEHNIWHWFNPSGAGFGFDFNSNSVTLLPDNPMLGNGHCKATICDQAGNLMFVSNGIAVFDKNYDIVENGDFLLGSESSHFGTSFLKLPGSDSEYILFTTSDEEVNFINGLRYSIINADANDGLGQVTDVKNVLVENTGVEHHDVIKHCNLIDKWLVFYDVPEGKFKSYLISEDGVSDTPVESELNLPGIEDLAGSVAALKPSPQGNFVMFNRFLFEFNQSTGEFTLVHTFDFDAIFAYDFSPNGKVLYFIHGEVDLKLSQFDLTIPYESLNQSEFQLDLDIFDIGVGLRKGKDNVMYYEKTLTGGINTINFPNFLGQDMDYQEDTYFSNTMINSFGSFYHGYISGKEMIIDGDEIICAGTDHEFSVYGSDCIDSDIEWEFSGDGDFTINANETVSASFPAVGEAMLVAKTTTGCGELTDTLHISVIQAPELDLGPDIGYCADDPNIVLEMSSEFDFYLWSTGSTEQSLILLSPEPQTIEGRGYFNGCYITDEIEIIGELSGEIDLGMDAELCDGQVIVLDAGPGYTDYLWQDGSTNQTFTAFLGGTYSVSVTEPCAASDMIVIDECNQSVGVSEEENEFTVVIFPNPAQDKIRIEFTNDFDLQRIEILDLQGKLVRNEFLSTTENSVTIDISDLAGGEYQIKLISNSTIQTEKFIKK